jgi:23S rRNA maturation-related 3'-5' exoribonuclease YhaM
MKYLVIVIFFISCNISAQKENAESLEDKKLNSMMGVVNANLSDNQKKQTNAAKESDKIVTQAANTITSLKAEVGSLKNQINEAKRKDSIGNVVDTSNKFQLRPISIDKKTR